MNYVFSELANEQDEKLEIAYGEWLFDEYIGQRSKDTIIVMAENGHRWNEFCETKIAKEIMR